MIAKLKTAEWMADPRAENLLRLWNVTWELREISLDSIDEKLSHENQARTVAIDPELEERYALCMLRGDTFPAIVVDELRPGRYRNLGGNNRVAAAKKAKRKTVLAYVLTLDDDQLRDLIPRSLNVVEGKGAEKDQRVRDAVHAVQTFGWSQKNAARTFAVGESEVGTAIRAIEVRDRLAKLKAPVDLPKTHLLALAPITNDNVLSQAAKISKEAKMSTEEIQSLSKKVRGERTELAQQSVLHEYETRLGVSANGKHDQPDRPAVQTSVATDFKRALTRLETILDNKRNLKQLQITRVGDEAEIKQRLNAIVKTIKSILSHS